MFFEKTQCEHKKVNFRFPFRLLVGIVPCSWFILLLAILYVYIYSTYIYMYHT